MIQQLQVVLGIAFLLATLFTAWTPGTMITFDPNNENPILRGNLPIQPLILTPDSETDVPRTRPLIGIVSGHWGNDSGAVCADGLTEAEVNQDIATRVQKSLVEKGFDVDLLKEFDARLTGYKATALVSIHNDSCDYINDAATGFKVASAMASPFPERAARLTACLRSRYAQATEMPLHSTSVTIDMTSYHAFGEIDANTTAAIIETGFLNLDRQFLTQSPDRAAEGITAGILCYLNNENVSAPPVQATPPPAEPTRELTQPAPEG